MDTIFVRSVREPGPAKQAGLQRGDRIAAVNGIPVTGHSYQQVVELIQRSPDYLHLLVVPKEDDVLQKYFAETAYNPVSNQDLPINDRVSAQHFLSQRLPRGEPLRVDQASWRRLQDPFYGYPAIYEPPPFVYPQVCPPRQDYPRVQYVSRQQDYPPVIGSQEYPQVLSGQEIYATVGPPLEARLRRAPAAAGRSRAQPQVPLYRRMGRRASEDNILSNRDRGYYQETTTECSSLNSDLDDMVIGGSTTTTTTTPAYTPSGQLSDAASYGRPTSSCRLSAEDGRRESCSSAASSLAGDGSMASYESLRGPGDDMIMNRFRKNFQQKEEFFRRSDGGAEQREFYGRPRKLEKCTWPPTEQALRTDSPTRTPKPTHASVQRVKEQAMVGDGGGSSGIPSVVMSGGQAEEANQHHHPAESPAHRQPAGNPTQDGMIEAHVAPATQCNGSGLEDEECEDYRDGYPIPQMVHRRARQFESGAPVPEDAEPVIKDRTSFYRSELARISSKQIVPNVTERAIEYETRCAAEPRRDNSDTSANTGSSTLRRSQRDSRSLESSDIPENRPSRMRARSNSAESWVAALANDHHRADGGKSRVTDDDKPVVVKRRVKTTNLADEERAMRRESYLKATGAGGVRFDSDHSDSDVSPQMLRSAHRRWRYPLFPGDIQQLRKLFEDAASSLGGSVSGNSSSSASLEVEKTVGGSFDKDRQPVIREGPLHCKITEIDGKRATDRSWKQIWAQLRGPKLFLYRDRHHQSPLGASGGGETAGAVEAGLAAGVDMRESVVRFAENYTKRKHVLRVSSINPCRSEFLLQADGTDELADWVRALQDQVAAATDHHQEQQISSKQQAAPVSSVIQPEAVSRLSPQPGKAKTTAASRNRSPTGQSPVSKTRKPSQIAEPATSPKSKTWRGKVVNKFKRLHQGASSPSSPTAPEGSTFGVALEHCVPSEGNQYVPRLVEVCTEIVEERGLETVGIYRVPGNNASITALSEEVNRSYEDVPLEDPRWQDLHVVGSLLKAYLRRLPDSLVTNAAYPAFLRADKIDNPRQRTLELRRLLRELPPHNYHTLKHVIQHLRRIVDFSEVNKMEAKNLAIVFGPTIVRAEEENMQSMVNNMTHQCRIVETLLNYCDWFFGDGEADLPVPTATQEVPDDLDPAHNQALLLDNITKYEALKDQKEKNGALFTSIISAAQRKVKRKTGKGTTTSKDTKEEALSPNGINNYSMHTYTNSDLKENSTMGNKGGMIPTTVSEIEKVNRPVEKVPWFNYSTDQEEFHRRIEHFEQETKAMLQMPRKSEIVVNLGPRQSQPSSLSSSTGSGMNQPSPVFKDAVPHAITKTHSASNVFTRSTPGHRPVDQTNRNSLDNARYHLDPPLGHGQGDSRFDGSQNYDRNGDARYGARHRYMVHKCADSNRNVVPGGVGGGEKGKCTLRRGSSAENVNLGAIDLGTSGNLKKVKYEDEGNQRTGSLDSIHKISNTTTDDENDLVTTMTQLYDAKLKEKRVCLLTGEGLPYADDSPEKIPNNKSLADKENIPDINDLYRNPSLHKSQGIPGSVARLWRDKEAKSEREKDVDTTDSVPDNERHISTHKLTFLANNTNKFKLSLNLSSPTRLKRSESLNKPERTVSPLSSKLKRSESLNKTGDRLKRSDSLTKNEKTETNLNKRRELLTSVRRSKESTKLKRKNGMPDRSIKRRHTVGGTKDPDKVTYTTGKENSKEKDLRTSSPDLSSMRREKLFFEINLIGPENMVVALRQHLIGTRPQSFPDNGIFKVPLESHV